MRKLILIKHAKPHVEDDVPSHEWELSREGRESCKALGQFLEKHQPKVIVTSDEPKAIETGSIVAEALEVNSRMGDGLHEHDRSNVPMMQSREFISTMALFFKDRHRLVLGKETAEAALDRFEQAVRTLLDEEPEGNIAVVTHGTVLALFAEAHGAGDGFGLWRKMGLPSVAVFSVPGFKLLELVDRIA
jgi:broad specificity phosphatase PhoE